MHCCMHHASHVASPPRCRRRCCWLNTQAPAAPSAGVVSDASARRWRPAADPNASYACMPLTCTTLLPPCRQLARAAGRRHHHVALAGDARHRSARNGQPLTNVASVSCGGYFTYFMMQDSTIFGIGDNSSLQLGPGSPFQPVPGAGCTWPRELPPWAWAWPTTHAAKLTRLPRPAAFALIRAACGGPPNPLANATWERCDNVPVGATCKAQCDEGFDGAGTTATCTAGTSSLSFWSSFVPGPCSPKCEYAPQRLHASHSSPKSWPQLLVTPARLCCMLCAACADNPSGVPFAVWNCNNTPHGASCVASCSTGPTATPPRASCWLGRFNVSGSCPAQREPGATQWAVGQHWLLLLPFADSVATLCCVLQRVREPRRRARLSTAPGAAMARPPAAQHAWPRVNQASRGRPLQTARRECGGPRKAPASPCVSGCVHQLLSGCCMLACSMPCCALLPAHNRDTFLLLHIAACLGGPPLLESPGLAGGWSCNSSITASGTASGTVCTAACLPGLNGGLATTCVRGTFSAVAGSCGERVQQKGPSRDRALACTCQLRCPSP